MPTLRASTIVIATVLLLIGGSAARADLDVVFVIDTTGSMGGELDEAQQRLRELAATLAQSRGGERLRFGAVAFRDRGDEYVTQSSALDAEIGTTDAFLRTLTAGGGGDEAESVIAALVAALRTMDWDRGPLTERRVILVGDAPAHLDYVGEPSPADVIEEARRAGIVIDTIGCRSLPAEGVALFRRFAYATEGSYQHIGRIEAPGGEEGGGRRGGLMAALGQATGGAAGRAAAGEDLALAPLGHRETPSAVLLVRTAGEGVGSDGARSCALEVLLPPGLGLVGAVEARRLPDRLLVRLPLGEGEGGEERFALASCLPPALPVDVEIEGGR